MFVIVDDRALVRSAFAGMFERAGVAALGLCAQDCRSWIEVASSGDITAAEAFLIGDCDERGEFVAAARRIACDVPVIAMVEERSLDDTLRLLALGCDDVVAKPLHIREVMARAAAIRRRGGATPGTAECAIQTFGDGRAPEVHGERLELPRRQRRILEFLVANRGCWVTKAQIFNSVYGVFSEDIGESVVESHISRLRARLRQVLGRDPIVARRYSGYMLDERDPGAARW